jgi:hypothetical protein
MSEREDNPTGQSNGLSMEPGELEDDELEQIRYAVIQYIRVNSNHVWQAV